MKYLKSSKRLLRFPLAFSPTQEAKKLLTVLFLAMLGLISALIIPVLSVEEPPTEPQILSQQGKEFYESGKLDQAIATWESAATAYEAQGDRYERTANLLNTATAQQALGLYGESCETILRAFTIEGTNCFDLLDEAQPLEQEELQGIAPAPEDQPDSLFTTLKPLVTPPYDLNQATGLLRLGDYFIQSNYSQAAVQSVEKSLEIARQLNDRNQENAALLELGNINRAIAKKLENLYPPQTVALDIIANSNASVTVALQPYQTAIDYYQQAALEAQTPLDSLKAQMNHLSLLLDTWEFWQKATTELANNLDQLGISDLNFRDKIQAGTKDLQFGISQELQPQIIALTQQIQPQLNNLPLNRGGIFAQINFSKSLIRQGLIDKNTAQILVSAIKSAREINNPTAEAEASGYLGHLYEQQQQYPEARQLTEKALALAPTFEYPEIAYRWHAQLGRILTQQNERESALAAYKTSFNTITTLRNDLATTPVEPIFREYISLLLQEEPTEDQLEEAREVLESLQISELDNFFRDPCSEIANEKVIIDNVDQKAAVIYPIILDKRLEVIVTIPGQPLERYTTLISREEIKNKINLLRRQTLTNPRFAEAFRGARGNPEQEQQVQKSLEESLNQDILPLAQEIYGWLIGPVEPSLQENDINTLVFVLDGALRTIPMAILYDGEKYLIEKDYNVSLTSGLQLTDPQPLKREPIRVLAAGTTKSLDVYNFPEIPKVKDELELIGSIFPGSEVLLNDKFTPEALRQKLEEANYPVVHLATHGQFSSTSDQTFIVSGSTSESDRLINVKQLDDLLRVTTREGAQPIELLVLSACNTAQGDDQAILGLAGVAVRAGARSTIATLWGANDDATAQLMDYFYQNLNNNQEISKAKALREAQLSLLQNPDSQYSHPYYWAPFVLIGNWL